MSGERVLSIQSHVVSGYVGNKAAVFPLQLLGFDVDIINSVHFSNHTGYAGGFEGDILDGDQLKAILAGLERNSLLDHIDHILTGYIGSPTFLRKVIDVVKTVRSHSRVSVRYVCDPVMGDNNEFYVPQELVDIYRQEVIPLADVVTPNQFEAEQLVNIRIQNIADAKIVCRKLHELGPSLVVLTSVLLESSPTISVIASINNNKNDDDIEEIYRIDTPLIPGRYTGTGDLCAALLLAWTAQDSFHIGQVLEKVIATMNAVIHKTSLKSNNKKSSGEESSNTAAFDQELELISSKKDIEQPPVYAKAYKV